MAKKVTRIKASDSPRKEEEQAPITRKKVVAKDKNHDKKQAEKVKKAEKAIVKAEKEKQKTEKKGFILFRPIKAFFRYLKNSWKELRQVRWPNRKATWKMVIAVLVYTAIFVVFISLLDLFFRWLFNLILK